MRGATPRGKNLFRNAVGVPQHVRVPEAQHSVALLVQELVADRVMLRVDMLAAVEFNNERGGATRKVGKVRPDRKLPNKPVPAEAPCPQHLPEPGLGLRFVAAQRASA